MMESIICIMRIYFCIVRSWNSCLNSLNLKFYFIFLFIYFFFISNLLFNFFSNKFFSSLKEVFIKKSNNKNKIKIQIKIKKYTIY